MDKHLLTKLTDRDSESNKYDFGHVLVIGGSPGMVGAPLLSAMAALRIGAGLVSIASTSDVIDKLEKRVLEVMTLRISSDPQTSIKEIAEFVKARRVSVVVIGPGMNEEFAKITPQLLNELSIPVLVDATGLKFLKPFLNENTDAQLIVTPHDGESKKFLDIDLSTELNTRIDQAKEFAQKYKLVFVCKGNPTIVVNEDGETFQNETGNPGLATAGSGDVLSGIIAGLIAQSIEGFQACQIGVYLHGLAADLAVKEKTQPGMIASDVIDYLPDAIKTASENFN